MATVSDQLRRGIPMAIWLSATMILLVFALGFANRVERDSLMATVALGVAGSCGAALLGGLLSYSISFSGRARGIYLMLTFSAATLPIYWHLAAWDALFGKLGWYSAVGGQTLQLAIPKWFAAIWIHSLAGAPSFALITTLFQLEGARVADEQGLIDAHPTSVFWHVTLVRQWPIYGLAWLWVFVSISREIAVTDIYQIGTVAEQIYLGFALGQMDQMLTIWPEGPSVISLRLYVLSVCWLAAAALWIVSRISDWHWGGEVSSWWQESPRFRTTANGVCLLLIALLLIAPLANLIGRAGFRVETSESGPVSIWSFGGLAAAVSRAAVESRNEFWWSTSIGIFAASSLFVISIGWCGLIQKHRLWQVFLFATVVLAFALPGPLIGAVLMKSWDCLPFRWAWWLGDRTILLQVLANCVFCWPLAASSIWLSLNSSPKDVLESAELQGGGGWKGFFALGLAGRKQFLCGLWLFLFVISFGELSAQQMVAAPGIDTIPRQLLGWMHSGVDELAAGTSLLVSALLTTLSVVAAMLLFRRQKTRTADRPQANRSNSLTHTG